MLLYTTGSFSLHNKELAWSKRGYFPDEKGCVGEERSFRPFTKARRLTQGVVSGSIITIVKFDNNVCLIISFQRYLTKHAYGNAETDDLWDAMTEVSSLQLISNSLL